MKKICALLLVVCLQAVIFCGCAGKESNRSLETVELTVWGSPDSQDMLEQMAGEFTELHKNEVNLVISVGEEGEDTLRENVIRHPGQAADVFAFASDQLPDLCTAGVLLEVDFDKEEVVEENGGADGNAVKSAMLDGKLYAYPMTASNGYFLYYNSQYFTEEDVKSLDTILETAARNGKYFAMDWTSGWYIYSFFGGAGMTVKAREDGGGNMCDYNRTDGRYKGVDVAEAMIAAASSPGFKNVNDEGFLQGIEDGSIIAGVNGTWNSKAVEKAFGDNYAAAKLPEYTISGDRVQMASFSGYKLIGVNAYTSDKEWAQKLARFLTNEDNQLKRFEITGEGPSNINAADHDEVQSTVAMAALMEQSEYSVLQDIEESYWTPSTVLGTLLASGNPDGKDLQVILDEFVKETEKAAGQ